jgi:threonine/homoserine/homoserine lactone efflux protein
MSALLSGIAAGFAVAMPVGPIGVLCIGRSLKDGFAMGLATGLGVATADAAYGLLVALGPFGLRRFFRPESKVLYLTNLEGEGIAIVGRIG